MVLTLKRKISRTKIRRVEGICWRENFIFALLLSRNEKSEKTISLVILATLWHISRVLRVEH